MITPGVLLAVLSATISANFEGGSTGPVKKVSDHHFRIGVKGEADQDKRNRQANWYFFRVDGASRSPLTFDIVDLPGEYNYQPNRGAVTKDTPPVISYDRIKWEHVTSFEYDSAEPRLRLRVMPAESRFWIAHTPPYTNEHLQRLRKELKHQPDAREEIVGKTVGGRDIYLWTITGRNTALKKTVWLMFRQHSWETGSSWAGEGAVRALLNDAGLRQSITWKIYPMCDPDGVARGGVRFNVHGYDLNRNWDVEDRKLMPEIYAQRKGIADWIRSGNTIDLFLSIHNTETAEYLQSGPQPDQPLGERFFAALKQHTTFDPTRPLMSSGQTTTEGMKGRMNVIQGLYRDFKVPGFLMEQRISYNAKLGRLPLIEDRLKFGHDLIKAIAAALAEPRPQAAVMKGSVSRPGHARR